MHADFKEFLIAAALFLLAVALPGCATKKIPIIKSGELAKVPAEVVKPAKRPPARSPANTSILEAGRQWGADRKGWGDVADQSDTKSRILCAERGWKIIDPKTGKNVCDLLTR